MIYLKLLNNKELKVNKTNPLFEGENNVDSIKINISERWQDFTCFLNIIIENEKQGDLFVISSDTEYLIPKEFLSKEQNLIIFIEMRKENDVVAKSTPILIKVDSHQKFEDIIEDVEISAFNQILEQAVRINQETLQIKKDVEDMLDNIENPAEEVEKLKQELATKAPLNSPNFKDSAYINDVKILTTEDKDIINEDLSKINTSLSQEIERAKSAEEQLNEKIDKKTMIDISSLDSSITVDNNKIGVQISNKEKNNLSLESDGLFAKKPEEYSVIKNNDNTYSLTKNGEPIGDSILIPKDLVVKSGRVQEDKLILILNNEEETEIAIDVSDLIEYVTSGSNISDEVQIIIDNDHKVSAQILESSISKDKLSAEIKKSLELADSSVQSQDIEKMQSTDNLTQILNDSSTEEEYPSAKIVYENFKQQNLNIEGKEDTINKVQSIDIDSDNILYPSAKAVYQFGMSITNDFLKKLENKANTSYVDEKSAELVQYFNDAIADHVTDIDQSYNSKSENAQSGKAVAEAIANLVGSAPDKLNTLEELADALKDNADIVDVLNEAIGQKVDKEEGKGLSTNDYTDNDKEKLENINSDFIITGNILYDVETDIISLSDMSHIYDDLLEAYNEGRNLKLRLIQGDSFYEAPLVQAVELFGEAGGFEFATVNLSYIISRAVCDRDGWRIDIEFLADANDTIRTEDFESFKSDLQSGEFEVDRAIFANLATNADYAQQANNDGYGNPIDETYATKAELRPTPITDIPDTLSPNTSYNFGEVESLQTSFPIIATDGDVIYLTFMAKGENTNIAIEFHNASDIDIEIIPNTGYEIYAKYNGSIWIVGYSEYIVTDGESQ